MINRWLTAAACFRQADVRAVVCYRQYTWLSWLEKNSSQLKPLCLSSSITYWICWLVPKSVPVLNGLLNAKYLLTMYIASPYPEVTDLICRLLLLKFMYRLDTLHLGHQLRISVRSGERFLWSETSSTSLQASKAPKDVLHLVLWSADPGIRWSRKISEQQYSLNGSSADPELTR